MSDPNNCGSCGLPCLPPSTCMTGICMPGGGGTCFPPCVLPSICNVGICTP
jgi:hypothetical protein